MNEPVVWMVQYKGKHDFTFYKPVSHDDAVVIPLYTHPVNPYQSITDTKIEPTVVSYTHPVKELTDEELIEFIESWEGLVVTKRTMEMLRAILRKAQEK